ncbi:Uncharacterised protein [Mycolicibacterium fortuitum]|uniref:Uncharacterized protein n=1 Tax=Mycolicibacterium fortuitum TaxID=1766 RepID=A0A378U546_MYCFO|nr:Uncharacterised protein [Mycolicibacterium fortuitum]
MSRKVGTDRLTVPGDDVEHTGRQSHGIELAGQLQCQQRCVLIGFEDHRVTGDQGRRDLPHCGQHRDVPRHDRSDHTEGFAHHNTVGGNRCNRRPGRLPFVVLRNRRQILHLGNRQPHVQCTGDADRGPVLAALQGREFLGAGAQPFGDGIDDRRPLRRRDSAPRPVGERSLGRVHRGIDQLSGAFGDGGDQFFCCRAVDLIHLVGVDPLAVDVHRVVLGHREHPFLSRPDGTYCASRVYE